jgi:Ca-activated chloride channel homolog
MIHFIRPLYLTLLIFLPIWLGYIYKKSGLSFDFKTICDEHLLNKILITNDKTLYLPLLLMFTILLSLILALAGPALRYDKIPSYQKAKSHIIVFDLSEDILNETVSPSKLQIAKFKLQDILSRKDLGQYALITYSAEAFVAAPITHDGKTIMELIPYLHPSIMPTQGSNLLSGLKMAQELIQNTPDVVADILVITATPPDKKALNFNNKIKTNYLIISNEESNTPHSIMFTSNDEDIKTWQNTLETSSKFNINQEDSIIVWQDEAKWLILLSLLLLAIFFRKSYLEIIL